MNCPTRLRSLAACLTLVTLASTASAEVTRVEIAKRQDIGGSNYEKLTGTVFYDQGFASDVYVLRPKDPAHGNGSMLFELDGGERTLLRRFNRGGPNTDPDTSADLGDGFLMKFGFALAWVGSETTLSADQRFSAVRDLAIWIKRQPNAALTARYVYAFGSSESRRLLNERQVFDAVWMHGADRSPIDVQPDTRVFVTNTPADYWTGRAGQRDETPPANVRAYYFAGAESVPSRVPPSVDYWWAMRALLLAMHRWVSAGTAPPANAYPRLTDRPSVDEDGNETAGVLLPDVAVPLATYSASPTFFPRTRAVRAATNDPRRSIEERYASRDDYLAKVRDAAESLVKRGYLLFDDIDRVVQRAGDTWDALPTSRD